MEQIVMKTRFDRKLQRFVVMALVYDTRIGTLDKYYDGGLVIQMKGLSIHLIRNIVAEFIKTDIKRGSYL